MAGTAGQIIVSDLVKNATAEAVTEKTIKVCSKKQDSLI